MQARSVWFSSAIGWLVLCLCMIVGGCTGADTAARSSASTQGLPSGTRVLRVGPHRPYTQVSHAAAAARDGDVIEVDAGLYSGTAALAIWRANRLIIRGVGGKAHMHVQGQAVEGKAIWVIKGQQTTVEHIEFSGARVSDRNGAGIRLEGAGLILRHCFFHDNENGLLTGPHPTSDILIEYSEFANNGDGVGYAHNIYVGGIRSLMLRYSYSHHARAGHLVKSRALLNTILYNRLTDEADGTSSYNIDLPHGGMAYLIGNLIQQSPFTENTVLVAFAPEGPVYPSQELYMVNNTLVNDNLSGVFLTVKGRPSVVKVLNNLFVGPGTVLQGPGEPANSLVTDEPGFVDRGAFDYRLTAGSSAIDAGIAPGTAHDTDLTPTWQYVHPVSLEPRHLLGKALDVGAYEFDPARAHAPGLAWPVAGAATRELLQLSGWHHRGLYRRPPR